MICNMVTKPTGRPRHRLRLPLREDPERYEIAYFLARQSPRMRSYAPRPTRLAKIITQARYGVVRTGEERAAVAGAVLEGRDFQIEMRKKGGRNDPTDKEQWRNRDSANALGENFQKKAVALLKKLPAPSDIETASDDEKDARWLSLMMESWHLVGGAYSYQGSPFAAAADLPIRQARRTTFVASWRQYFLIMSLPVFTRPTSFRRRPRSKSNIVASLETKSECER
jgi:hypothetical protein